MEEPIDTGVEEKPAKEPGAESPSKSLAWRKVAVAISVIMLALPLLATGLAAMIIAPSGQYMQPPEEIKSKNLRVGLVLGAGVAPDGKPYKELQSRLDTAAEALDAGVIDKLILSGDNRFEHYDEPQAMTDYLVQERQVDASKLQPDFAGRSTFESCERAAKVFQLDRVVLISAGSHLPRAIFLCRHFGIEAYGIASPVEANNSWRRELLARVKAVYNAYLIGEPTVLGDPIRIE